MNDFTVNARIVVKAETQDEAEDIVAQRLNEWFHTGIDHNKSVEKKVGMMAYWDIIKKPSVPVR